MKARYANDTAKGPGYGIIFLSQVPLEPLLEGCRFSVQRSSDKQFLIPGNWQDAESLLEPAWTEAKDESLLLYVGYDVVDQLDELETYRFCVVSTAGTREAAILALSGLVYSPMYEDIKLAGPQAPPATPPKPPVPVVPDTTLPDETVAATTGAVAGTGAGEPVSSGAGEISVGDQPVTSAPRPWWPRLAAVLGVLLLLAAGGWWYWQHGRPVAATPPEAAKEEKAPVAGTPSADKDAGKDADKTSESAKETPPLAPLEQARAFLRTKGAPEKAFELSQSMPQTSDGRDAAFLLLGAAAEGGHGPAMLHLAQFYDPADKAPAGTIQKDAEQARAWYTKAKAAGEAEAATRLDALAAWQQGHPATGSAGTGSGAGGKP